MTQAAVSIATAKQIACAPRMIAVLTPTTSPREFSSGPPELPGLSAASVWITSGNQPAGAGAHAAAERADDAGGDRVLEAERVADGDGDLAAAQVGRAAEHGRRERQPGGGADVQQRQVGIGVVADPLGGRLDAVAERDLVAQSRPGRGRGRPARATCELVSR
jgi:hypothetical protein